MNGYNYSCEQCIHNGVCGFEEKYKALKGDIVKIIDDKYKDTTLGCDVICKRFMAPWAYKPVIPFRSDDQVNYREPGKGVWVP